MTSEVLAFPVQQADDPAARAARLQARVRELVARVDPRTGSRFVVGDSPEWRRVLTEATQVAGTNTTVLLLGESGTGKEVVARFLHRASTRASGSFVALNCAALPEHLLEAELFGYERGAGGRRHALPRRGRRDEPVGAGQVPARAAGARVPAARRHAGPATAA
jgi:transcriptional regulator with GAF, ATPase, and Fis domain